jgi:hypothetical protein
LRGGGPRQKDGGRARDARRVLHGAQSWSGSTVG